MKKTQTGNILEVGREIYYQLRPKISKKYNPGDYISIEVESGDFFVGKTTVDALEKAKKKHPGKKFFLAQVGQVAGILK